MAFGVRIRSWVARVVGSTCRMAISGEASPRDKKQADKKDKFSLPLANRYWPRRRCGMIPFVLGKDRLESFLRPKFRGADLLQARGVPIKSRARRRPPGLHRLRDGADVVRFR